MSSFSASSADGQAAATPARISTLTAARRRIARSWERTNGRPGPARRQQTELQRLLQHSRADVRVVARNMFVLSLVVNAGDMTAREAASIAHELINDLNDAWREAQSARGNGQRR